MVLWSRLQVTWRLCRRRRRERWPSANWQGLTDSKKMNKFYNQNRFENAITLPVG
jgi:hypothetical protein